MYNILTPGPTKVAENVRMARALETTNPDLDPAFYEFYRVTCAKYSHFLNTANPSFILSGEGILGLEAACASLTEPGDRVLVLDNGLYGKGFADFVKLYGGEPVLYTVDSHAPIAAEPLRAFLKKDSAFKYATLVHCDTPSGMLNDIHTLCPILKEYGILTVVDSVSGMFGNPVDVRKAKIDILCGGSQKALSCPPGLTMVSVSHDAFHAMESRKTPIASFYCNLLLMKELAKKCREGRRQYYLTAAITPGKYVGNATAGIPDELFDYVDWFNVMVYDDYSETREGMHHSTYDLMLESVDYWVGQRGLPLSKFVVGLPAYGVPSGIRRSGNTRDYNGIIRAGGSCMGDVAMITSTQHPSPYPVYYNGIRTIRAKTAYALGNGLGGVMFWEIAGDRHDDLSLVAAAYDQVQSQEAASPSKEEKHGKRK